MSKALYKAPFVNVDAEQVRVIDADALFQEKVGELPPEPENSDDPVAKYGFDPYGDGESPAEGEEASVSALFGEEDAGAIADTEEDILLTVEDDGFSSGIPAESVEEATMGVGVVSGADLEEADRQAQEILEQAQQQAQEILEQAQQQAQQMADAAMEEGRKKGHEEGFAQGMQEAVARGEAARAEYEAKAEQMRQEYDEKLRMMEPHLVEELTGIYEHIFTVDLSTYRSVIQHLITNTMHALDASQSYLIHVSPQDYSALAMQKAALREESNMPQGAVMELVEDISLGKNQCLIETDDGIFDCSLTVELAELKRKLMLLAYEGAAR